MRSLAYLALTFADVFGLHTSTRSRSFAGKNFRTASAMAMTRPFKPTPASKWEGPDGDPGSLAALCSITKRACDLMAPMISSMYESINSSDDSDGSGSKKLKDDRSVFSIADGMVQHLLTQHMFGSGRLKVRDIVGEEDCHVDISSRPLQVDDLIVPEAFSDMIEKTRDDVDDLSKLFADPDSYSDLTAFIDPIDGTREFTSNKGEQCSVCIGFADESGRPVAGVVYRPLTNLPTWAAGAKGEGYMASELQTGGVGAGKDAVSGLLTSNGSISPFLVALMDKLGFARVPSGGAGNKMLMLLEGRGTAYIQDRGVSRWDTCAAQAVLEAHGGILCKLTSFLDDGVESSYTYLRSDDVNLDFEPGKSNLTVYNCSPQSGFSNGDPSRTAQNLADVKPYSNLCGLVALRASNSESKAIILAASKEAAKVSTPSYD